MQDTGANKEGFRLPEGFFKDSADRLRHAVDCLDELRECPTLTALKGRVPFAVPGGYFAQQLEVFSVAKLRSHPGFAVPPGFFDQQAESLRAQAALNGDIDAAPQEQGFSTPEGYFGDRARQLKNLSGSGKGKLVRMHSLRVIYYAAAALLVMAVGIWTYRILVPAAGDGDCQTIACLERKEVLKSYVIDNLNEEDLMMLVDDDLEFGRPAADEPSADDSAYIDPEEL